MTRLSVLLLAGSLLVSLAPAVPQAHEVPTGYGAGANGGGDWNNGGATYDQFTQEYDHIAQMIQHGRSDGSLNYRQIAGSWNELRYIKRLAYAQQQRGYYNPQIIQARLTRLHDGLHLRHEQGHEAQQRAYGNDGQYGGGQYGNSQYGNGHHDDNPGAYDQHDEHEHDHEHDGYSPPR